MLLMFMCLYLCVCACIHIKYTDTHEAVQQYKQKMCARVQVEHKIMNKTK